MIRTLILVALAGMAFSPIAVLADTAAQVKDCEGCHGNNGVSEWSDVPTIAGISAGVHGDYLLSYKDKSRPCTKSKYRQGDTKRPETDMCSVAAKLSEADIEALAAHFSAKPFKAAKQTVDAAKAAAGKTHPCARLREMPRRQRAQGGCRCQHPRRSVDALPDDGNECLRRGQAAAAQEDGRQDEGSEAGRYRGAGAFLRQPAIDRRRDVRGAPILREPTSREMTR